MEIRWNTDEWCFEEMDPFVCELLRALPSCALPDDDAAHERIFSSPTQGADKESDQEWRENVIPELREHFQAHVDAVISNLNAMTTEGELSAVRIPAANALAWIHTLNQARLALGARHGITGSDIEGRRKPRSSAKAHALMQIDFYGTLLGLLLARTEI